MKNTQHTPSAARPASGARIISQRGQDLLAAHYQARQQGFAQLGGLTVSSFAYAQRLLGGNIF